MCDINGNDDPVNSLRREASSLDSTSISAMRGKFLHSCTVYTDLVNSSCIDKSSTEKVAQSLQCNAMRGHDWHSAVSSQVSLLHLPAFHRRAYAHGLQ